MTCRKSLHPTENSRSMGSALLHEYAKYVQKQHQVATSCQSAYSVLLVAYPLLSRTELQHGKLNHTIQHGKLLAFVEVTKNHAGDAPALGPDFSTRSFRSFFLCVHATS